MLDEKEYDEIQTWQASKTWQASAQNPSKLKKILFLEGVDGAGKSTIARTVSRRLTESGIRSMVVNEGHPSEYGMLYKLDEKKGFRSSALARLSYRFSRLNIAIHYAMRQKRQVALFEGGLLNFYVQCQMDGIEDSLINRYLNDLSATLAGTKLGTVLLRAETSVIRRRLESRPEPSRNDRNPQRWLKYKKGLREAFNNGVAAGELMELDTGTLSVEETVEAIVDFLG